MVPVGVEGVVGEVALRLRRIIMKIRPQQQQQRVGQRRRSVRVRAARESPSGGGEAQGKATTGTQSPPQLSSSPLPIVVAEDAGVVQREVVGVTAILPRPPFRALRRLAPPAWEPPLPPLPALDHSPILRTNNDTTAVSR